MNITQLLVSLASVIIGLIMFLKPAFCIEFQKKFYAKINWRLEPIDMKLEIRSTRIMGLFLIVITLAAVAYILIRGAR